MKRLNFQYLSVQHISRFLVLLFITNFSFYANAGIKLKLIEGKKFTDYEMSDESRSRSLKSLEKDLNKLFIKVFPEYAESKKTLEIDITNVDLPGYYYYSGGFSGRGIRIVDSYTPYKLYFSYRVKDADGEIMNQGEYKLRKFFDSFTASRLNRRRGTVDYYLRPLKNWSKKTFTTN